MASDSHLNLLLDVSEILHSGRSLQESLVELLERVVSTLGAERGFVVMRSGEDLEILARHRITEMQARNGAIFSSTVVWKVIREGEPVRTLNALEQESFQTPSLTLSKAVSLLVVPLIWGEQVRGALYIDNSLSKGVFLENHEEILLGISRQAARTLETAELYERLQETHWKSLDSLSEDENIEEKAAPETLDRTLRQLGDGAAELSSEVFSPNTDAPVQIFLFGELRVLISGELAPPWKSRKDRELFCYLALQHGLLVHEEKLAELFWPRAKKPKHSLQNAVTQLRRILGGQDSIQRRQEGYALNPDFWCDFEAFRDATLRGRMAADKGDWDQALSLLRSSENLAREPLLRGMEAEWLEPFRLQSQEELVECQSLQAEYFAKRGKHILAIELWKRVIAIDSCHDIAYEHLISSCLALGRRTQAQRVYQQALESYQRDLDMEPPESLKELVAKL